VNALNAAVVTWAGQQSTTESPVAAVDRHTGYHTATDTVDGVSRQRLRLGHRCEPLVRRAGASLL